MVVLTTFGKQTHTCKPQEQQGTAPGFPSAASSAVGTHLGLVTAPPKAGTRPPHPGRLVNN